MKAEHILLLVLAGALGGAGLMNVIHKPRPVAAHVAVRPQPVAPQATVAVAQPPQPVAQPPQPVAQPPQPLAQPPQPVVQATEPVVQAPRPEPAAPLVREIKPRFRPAPVRSEPTHSKRALHFIERPPIFVAKPAPQIAQVQRVEPPPPAPAPAPVIEAPKPEPAVVRQEPAAPPAPAPAPAPPQAPTVTLSAGMLIPVRLLDGLSSERNAPGDTFLATLDHELVADGFVIAERGARVEGRVVSSSRGTRTKGGAALTVELTRLHTSDGQRVAIHTDAFDKQMEPDRRQDAEKIAGGAIIGAAIGAIAGGGKGAAVGAGAGGGIGAGDVLLTRKPAALPSETRLSFRLSAPVTLTEQR
jgi:hypothetical protein